VRGASTVDDSTSIVDATEMMMREVLARNRLAPSDLVSCVFTLTPDLIGATPEMAMSRLGLGRIPVSCILDIAVPDALERVVRVLVHCYVPGGDARNVYLGETLLTVGPVTVRAASNASISTSPLELRFAKTQWEIATAGMGCLLGTTLAGTEGALIGLVVGGAWGAFHWRRGPK
jgi:chorismate mutase